VALDLTNLPWAVATFDATGAPSTNRTQYLDETSVTCGTTVYYRPLAAAAIALNPTGTPTGPVLKQDLIDGAVTYGTGSANNGSSLAERQAALDRLIPCFQLSQFGTGRVSRFKKFTVTL
jgi:hypothetical protein